MVFVIGHYRIETDVEKTRAFYENMPLISEACSCSGCRNFESALSVLPEQVIGFFSSLGIDMRKLCEVGTICNNPDGTVLYHGFTHLSGTILQGESAWVRIIPMASHWETERTNQIDDGFNVLFKHDCALLEPDFPAPAIQLEISASIPWVVSEENHIKY